MRRVLSVILPASNEEAYIGACLDALLASDPVPGGAEVIVVSNGSRDATAAVARQRQAAAAAAGWRLEVLDLAEGGKPGALNAGDAAARGALRAYLDADVIVSPPLMKALVAALGGDQPLYAGGTPVIPKPRSEVTRAYARFWQRLPFNRSAAPGYGLFAVNGAGRARWAEFPAIISDDTFVRLQFAPGERVQVAPTYLWPMVEGFAALTRVRRRQDAGVREIATLWPDLPAREGKARLGKAALARLALADPVGFAVYAAVTLAVRLRRQSGGWTRGR
ncbi:glycosyltransferase [Gemmobacter sp. LW-1]|uniref:glycosyltransferase n=1 Tax=Gemmobacter sp. LW-1 TaxID=1529005 RepID=UPI00128F2A7D|nr:glycosyltransferase family 2 protein [Gemmobacter sp. LW-1]